MIPAVRIFQAVAALPAAMGLLCLVSLAAPSAGAQAVDLTGKTVADIRVEGLNQVSPELVLNQVRLKRGMPFDRRLVEQDVVRITHLGRFKNVKAQAVPLNGSVVVTFIVEEQPLLSDVQVVGNKVLNDQELLRLVILRSGDPIDEFLINRGIREIRTAYRKEGYFLTEVSVDRNLLTESNILIYRVREGPLVKVQDIRFRGNTVFSDDQLYSQIRSRTEVFIFRKGELSREMLDSDVAALREYYRDRGYLEAQVGRRIDLSDDQKDAIVVFFIEEGPQYIVDSITVEGAHKFPQRQVLDTMSLHPGDVYTEPLRRRSQQSIIDLYGKLGYLETQVRIDRLFHEREPKVDLVVNVSEGLPSEVGRVIIRGNELTKDKVILRGIVWNEPGRRFDRQGIEITKQRLRESSLFSEAEVTVLGQPGDEYRDVLVEVTETNTGRLSFGAGISSDAGIVGAIDLVQRNFDIADWPDSFDEFVSGRAFRGAGQYFRLSLQPGNEFSRYSVAFREPYFLDSDLFFDASFQYFNREREDWEEERLGGSFSIGQRFGDIWSARVVTRIENVGIDDIEADAPLDVFDVEGDNQITSLGLVLTRSTVDSSVFPTRGSRLTMGVSRTGALGGDFDFTSVSASYNRFWTVEEDFLERKTVLSLRMSAAYIIEEDEAPLFERFHAGGHRTFRGFAFRGVGPRGIRADTGEVGDDPVGGDWRFLAGVEYNWPIFQDVIRGVLFVDSGTVQERFGFEDYRVSVGAGLRIRIPFLGQAPFAIDFAVPIIRQDDDEEQVFSFDLDIPLR